MAWQTPKTDWTAADGVTNADLNRIEGNIAQLKSSGDTTATSLNSHINNKSNPHGVTAAQLGAASASHKHGGGDITSAVANANYATSAGNADTVDGKHASAFALANHSHSEYIPVSITTSGGTYQNYQGGRLFPASSVELLCNKNTWNIINVGLVLNMTGTLRFKYSYAYDYSGYTGYICIFRNGSAVGTQRTAPYKNPTIFTEDINGWNPGDIIQIGVRASDSGKYGTLYLFEVSSSSPGGIVLPLNYGEVVE